MPKYLLQAKYSQGAVKAILADGGTARRALVEKTIANLGGRLEAFYFTFGAQDAVAIIELPDNATAAALSMNVGAAGAAVQIATTPLLTCEEIDSAARTTVDYTPPGG